MGRPRTADRPRKSFLPAKIRVYELARELGLTNKETLDLCVLLGIGVNSHSSSDAGPRTSGRSGRRLRPTQPADVALGQAHSTPSRPSADILFGQAHSTPSRPGRSGSVAKSAKGPSRSSTTIGRNPRIGGWIAGSGSCTASRAWSRRCARRSSQRCRRSRWSRSRGSPATPAEAAQEPASAAGGRRPPAHEHPRLHPDGRNRAHGGGGD